MTSEHPMPGPAPSRHPWLLLAVVLTVLVTITVTVVVLHDGSGDARANAADEPSSPTSETPRAPEMPVWSQGPSRWVGYGDVEVMAPRSWGYDYPVGRPDCISDTSLGADGKPKDEWAQGVPQHPYVDTGTPNLIEPAIGCFRSPSADDPAAAFGELPFALWQPYVSLGGTGKDSPSTTVTYRGWRLTSATVHGVGISVLSAPGDDDLGAQVIASARKVSTTVTGCAITSRILEKHDGVPSGAPLPAADAVGAVAVCDYGSDGLAGSRRLTGDDARDLVRAIQDAPTAGGPDHPGNCVHDSPRGRAIVLRTFSSDDATTDPSGEAWVYFDDCFGNGVFDSAGVHALTAGDCAPLFAQAPISLWEGDEGVFERCDPES